MYVRSTRNELIIELKRQIKEEKMVRMRTILQTIEYLKEKDPNTAITEWWLRQNLRNGTIKHHKAGNRYLLDLNALEEHLSNPPIPDEELDSSSSRKIRKA